MASKSSLEMGRAYNFKNSSCKLLKPETVDANAFIAINLYKNSLFLQQPIKKTRKQTQNQKQRTTDP